MSTKFIPPLARYLLVRSIAFVVLTAGSTAVMALPYLG